MWRRVWPALGGVVGFALAAARSNIDVPALLAAVTLLVDDKRFDIDDV